MKNVFDFMNKRLNENYKKKEVGSLTLFINDDNNIVAILTNQVINLFLKQYNDVKMYILTITKNFKRVENTNVKVIDAITISKMSYPFNYIVNENNKFASKEFIIPKGHKISSIGTIIITDWAMVEIHFYHPNFKFLFKFYNEFFKPNEINIHYLDEKKTYNIEPNDSIYSQCFDKYEKRNLFYTKTNQRKKIRHYLVNYNSVSKGKYEKLEAN